MPKNHVNSWSSRIQPSTEPGKAISLVQGKAAIHRGSITFNSYVDGIYVSLQHSDADDKLNLVRSHSS